MRSATNFGKRHLSQRRKQVEEHHQGEHGPDRLHKMPVKRPKRIGRTRNRPALEWVDPRFEPAEHLAFRSFAHRKPARPPTDLGTRLQMPRRAAKQTRDLYRQLRKAAAFLQRNRAASGHVSRWLMLTDRL